MEQPLSIIKNHKYNDKREPVDIIVPTFNNQNMLNSALSSMISYSRTYPIRIIIVNNGDTPIDQKVTDSEFVSLVDVRKNLGWAGGLIEGLKHSSSKYVMFANDDIFIPRCSSDWLKEMVREMDMNESLGAVGPSSNVVSGVQNIFDDCTSSVTLTSYLIGFCMLVRREALDKAGGVQIPEFGGDDFDLSIRIRKAGYLLAAQKTIFVYHHGFVTGHKIHGTRDKPGGWNSTEMIENTNHEIIRKHGLREFVHTTGNVMLKAHDTFNNSDESTADVEGNLIREMVNGGSVLEIGCGAVKTVENSTGVDIIPGGENIPFENIVSVADIVADVTEPLPFEDESYDCLIARHLVEHCVDTIGLLNNFHKVLKKGGNMIIACPDESQIKGIPLNPEHFHAFTSESFVNIAELCGFKKVKTITEVNGISFIANMEVI